MTKWWESPSFRTNQIVFIAWLGEAETWGWSVSTIYILESLGNNIWSLNIGRKKMTRCLALFPFHPTLFLLYNFLYKKNAHMIPAVALIDLCVTRQRFSGKLISHFNMYWMLLPFTFLWLERKWLICVHLRLAWTDSLSLCYGCFGDIWGLFVWRF